MEDPIFKFHSHKSAQAAAFILKRVGGEHTKGHLVKMLYGADRRQMRRTGIPITGDTAYSMRNGPILSGILEILDGKRKDAFWNAHISTASQDNYKVKLLAETPNDLLSENEKEALEVACDFLRNKTWAEVQAIFHNTKHFAEWTNPGGSRELISQEQILENVGQSPEFIEDMRSLRREKDLLHKLFA